MNKYKFYVRDGKFIKYFDSVSKVVTFLEMVVNQKLKMSKNEWQQHIVDLGHGPDERAFVESLQEHVEIGCVQKDGKHVRCSIYEATVFDKPEYGD